MSVLATREQSSVMVNVLSGDGATTVKAAEQPPEVSIIIVNWRSREYVRVCLESIAQTSRRNSYEVLVVDNDSGDGCGAMLEEQFPQARYIQSTANLGFARANNLAATKA